MASVYLGLGSNIDPEKNLGLGVSELRRRFGDLSISGIYRSAAIGFDGEDFLNLVVGLRTGDSPAEIHEQIDAIHEIAGRQRSDRRYSPRTLDVDLLLYDKLIIAEPPLRLPRPDVLKYSFVLKPLSEIAPDYVHPETGRTLSEHWQEFDVASHPLTLVRVVL